MFNLTNRYANIAITIAVAIAFPVLISDKYALPICESNDPMDELLNNTVTIELFKNSKNLTKSGAVAIAIAPKK